MPFFVMEQFKPSLLHSLDLEKVKEKNERLFHPSCSCCCFFFSSQILSQAWSSTRSSSLCEDRIAQEQQHEATAAATVERNRRFFFFGNQQQQQQQQQQRSFVVNFLRLLFSSSSSPGLRAPRLLRPGRVAVQARGPGRPPLRPQGRGGLLQGPGAARPGAQGQGGSGRAEGKREAEKDRRFEARPARGPGGLVLRPRDPPLLRAREGVLGVRRGRARELWGASGPRRGQPRPRRKHL